MEHSEETDQRRFKTVIHAGELTYHELIPLVQQNPSNDRL